MTNITKFTSKIAKGFKDPKQALVHLTRLLIRQIFHIAPLAFPRIIERVAADAQGKGSGTSIYQENKIVARLLERKPLLAIDIGGNIGEYTAELRRGNADLEIHVFEPANTNIKRLRERFLLDPLISVIPFALSNSAGDATLYSDVPGSGLGSLTKRHLDHLSINFNSEQTVSTMRFEEYWKTNLASRKLDIVKIDIEGHEFAALEGFGSAIFEVSVLQFEFGGCNIDTRTFFQDFWKFFQDRNFDIFRITPTGMEKIKIYREADECFLTTNYVARNRNYRKK